MRALAVACGMLLGLPGSAIAQDFSWSGLIDARLVAPSGQSSNLDGGFGKLRWGDGRGSPVIPDLGGAILRGSAALTPDLRVVAEIRYDPRQKTAVDLIDAYVRWRPVSTSRWRLSLKAGAFFPPVSLENTNIGWTPEWTVTSSAINSWVGEELRILGGEAMLEWRGDVDRLALTVSAFGMNEPAGEAIADRGWTFSDRPTGLLDHIRLPNVEFTPPGPAYSYNFRQLDHAVGWYAGVSWERPDVGRIALLHYDNGADPAAFDGTEFGWRTKFWSLGLSTQIGPVVLLSQGMIGTTAIVPNVSSPSTTAFWAWYVLAGIERGAWRYALRLDQFGTREITPGFGLKGDERGMAGTAAVTWTPRKGMSITGEVLTVGYDQSSRAKIGKSPHAIETQAQLAFRLSF